MTGISHPRNKFRRSYRQHRQADRKRLGRDVNSKQQIAWHRTLDQKAKRWLYRQQPEVKAKRREDARAYYQKHRKRINARERAN